MIYYVDIDETICDYEGGDKYAARDYKNARPIKENIQKINDLYDEGHTVVYWTARGGTTGIDWSRHTKKQIDNRGCQYTRIELQKKPVFDLFIDDKSKRIEEI